MNLNGKLVLLTGATGGLGRAIAEALAARGATLVLSSRKGAELEQLAASLPGDGHRVEVCDLAEEGEALRLLDAAGEIDVLVANAALPASGRLEGFAEGEVERALREHLDGLGFTAVDAPIFTPAAAEGTATLFKVDYFGESAFLSQTGQLYMEAAAQGLGKVYCFGPTFRAEKSKTRRHLTEFWMLEPEIAFGDFEEALSLMESSVCHAVARVLLDPERQPMPGKLMSRKTALMRSSTFAFLSCVNRPVNDCGWAKPIARATGSSGV